jgi:hypothetical protein
MLLQVTNISFLHPHHQLKIFIQNIFHKIKNVALIGDEKKNQTLENIVDGDECMKAALLEHFSQTCLV